jgi:hypothetical protein
VVAQIAFAIALGSIAISTILLIVRHIGWNWREHPQQSMIYMQGVNPADLTAKPAEAAA